MLRLRGFWKTPEGVKEFEKIGQPYGNTIMDNEYEDWLRKTKDSPLTLSIVLVLAFCFFNEWINFTKPSTSEISRHIRSCFTEDIK